MASTERARLEAAKQASLLQVLFKAARLSNERAQARVNAEAGATVFRESMARLLPHLTPEGVRVVELARKLDVSKQAVSKTVADFVAQGVLEYVSEPEDARARRVRLSAKGYQAVHQGLGVLRALEGEYAKALGEKKVRALHRTLLELVALLEGG